MQSDELRLTVVVDGELKKKFKLICAIKGQSLKERVEELIKKDIYDHRDKLDAVK